jgi:hypothetical protein
MHLSAPLRLLASAIAGFLVGVLALLALRAAVPGVADVVYVLSYPGIRLGRLWTDAGLPPHGEAAFGIIASGILIQWIVLGLACGFYWKRRLQAPTNHHPPAGRAAPNRILTKYRRPQ